MMYHCYTKIDIVTWVLYELARDPRNPDDRGCEAKTAQMSYSDW